MRGARPVHRAAVASRSSGQQMHKPDPEGHAGLRQQPHRLMFGIPGGEAGFQPGDQRPQLADGICGPPAVAGDVGLPITGAAEREHGGEVGVVRAWRSLCSTWAR